MKDVVIVGAGPSGSLAAMHAARLGMDVTIFDKAKFPRHKSCGGALSFKALPILGPKASKAINTISHGVISYAPSLKSAEFSTSQDLHLVIRKEWDHQVLLDAIDAGVEAHEETMVSTIEPHDDHITVETKTGMSVNARYVIIADGAGLRSYKKRLGFTQPYDYMARTVCVETPMDDVVIDQFTGEDRKIRIFFGVVPRGYGWVFPKRGYMNIGIGFSNQHHPDQNQFEIFDGFILQLKKIGFIPEDFDASGRQAAPIPFKKPFTPIGQGNILLVGDAGGFVSPVTGEGIYYGLVTGKTAVETFNDDMDGNLESDVVSSYTERWMKIFGDDMINYGLPLADMIYKSIRRMEMVVKLMIADEQTCKIASEMILGMISYRDAKSRIFRRAPLSLLKSLRV